MKIRTQLGILVAAASLLVISAQPMLAIGGLRTASSVSPAAGGYFGAKLDSDAFPSNAYSGQDCPDPGACTRVMNRAYNGGIVEAPKPGYVDRIKIAAGTPGSFRLFFVKVKPGTHMAKAVKKGPVISYQGQPGDGDPMVIETFDISDIYVQTGWRLAIRSSSSSLLRCDSGNGSFTYQPTLAVGGAYVDESDNSSCALLIKAIYR